MLIKIGKRFYNTEHIVGIFPQKNNEIVVQCVNSYGWIEEADIAEVVNILKKEKK